MKDERPIGRLVLAGADLWRAFDDRDRPLGIWRSSKMRFALVIAMLGRSTASKIRKAVAGLKGPFRT